MIGKLKKKGRVDMQLEIKFKSIAVKWFINIFLVVDFDLKNLKIH